MLSPRPMMGHILSCQWGTLKYADFRELRPHMLDGSNERLINEMEYSADGNLLMTSADDGIINLFDTTTSIPTLKKVIEFPRFGTRCAKFLSDGTSIVHSTIFRQENDVRRVDLETGKVMRKFEQVTHNVPKFFSHGYFVTNVKANKDNGFMTVTSTGAILLWDTRMRRSTHQISYECSSLVAEYSGKSPNHIVVGVHNKQIEIVDIRHPYKPLTYYFSKYDPEEVWHDIKTSPDNEHLMICNNSDIFQTFSLETGDVTGTYIGHKNDDKRPLRGCFTSDGKYVVCGSQDRQIVVWELGGDVLNGMTSAHQTIPEHCASHPKKVQIATAGDEVQVWNFYKTYDDSQEHLEARPEGQDGERPVKQEVE